MDKTTGSISAALHPQENIRLDFLRTLGVLDTLPEQRFDIVTGLIRKITGCAIATVTLVDDDRQWFKSVCGLNTRETSRDLAFCAHTILEEDNLIINNALDDERFKYNPLVTGDPYIRAYAGIVIRADNNLPLGSLCAIDTKARQWSKTEIEILTMLVKLVERELFANIPLELERSKAQIEANIDPVLNCLDFKGFSKILSSSVNKYSDKFKCSVFSYSIKNLDSLNFKNGYSVIAKIMIESVLRCQNVNVDVNALIGRLDRNTLAVYYYDLSDEEKYSLINITREELSRPYIIEKNEYKLEISFGVIDDTEVFDGFESIYYAISHLHKVACTPGLILCFENDDEAKNVRRKSLIREKVSDALMSNKFVMHYQPKVSVIDLKLIGFEALLRWVDPELGYVSPPDLIECVNELGLSNELSMWTIRYVMQDILEWGALGVDIYPVSINLSADQLKLTAFPGYIKTELEKIKIDPKLIEFEILEGTLIEELGVTRSNMEKLNEMGIKFSIDDFGTGYSALKLLNELPLNTIKIDRSFVENIAESREDSSLVHTIITIGHDAGFKIVAEGVETYEQFLILRALDCDYIQGYYFSKPEAEERITRLLMSGGKFSLSK